MLWLRWHQAQPPHYPCDLHVGVPLSKMNLETTSPEPGLLCHQHSMSKLFFDIISRANKSTLQNLQGLIVVMPKYQI